MMMRNKVCLATAVVLLSLAVVGGAWAEKMPLAVVAFDVRGVEEGKQIGSALGEIFSVKLGPYFRIIERVQVARLVEEQKFEATDLVEDAKKATRLGKLLRAEFIMVGSLNKFGDSFLLVARIIKCSSGEQFKGGSALMKSLGDVSDAADKVIRSMGLKAEASVEGPPPPPQGLVLVRPGLYRCERDRALMVYVKPGSFEMGSEGIGPAEKPVHQVKVKGFFMDRTEVTNRSYARFLNMWGKDVDTFGKKMIYPDPTVGLTRRGEVWTPVKGYEDHPVVRVTWFGAAAYAKWAGKSLPTEAQWEYAARGAEGRAYPWGKAAPTGGLAVFGRRPPDRTLKCGILKDGESSFGVLDMAGNVEEWCADWFDPGFYDASPFENPVNDEGSDDRSVRGGTWYDSPSKLLSARRSHRKPNFSDDTLGFRCVKLNE
ncbi:MAG: formylglycine-generating enzyme family protein [Planctomycetota bacterium]|jgi:formylglycine-generating enzyme required for sulfatase activity